MQFHPQWDVPDADQVLAYIQETYPDETKKLNMEQALAFAAMYSQSILGEDVEDAQVPGLTPEMVNFFKNVNLKGNPIERGMKAATILKKEGNYRMQQVLNEYGEEVLTGIIEGEVQRTEEEWESGRGGQSHGGDWFGGMEIDSPIQVSDKQKAQIMELSRKLKTFKSFNLNTKRSNKMAQDDWGDDERAETGLPDNLQKTDMMDVADEDLFDYLFMIKSLRYFETYSRKVLPNTWLVLIDDSGSMNNTQKLSWLLALLHVICEDVIKNNSVAYVAMFEEDLSPFWKLDSKKSIQDFMSQFRGGYGGDTDIQGALQNVARQLKNGMLQSWDGPPHIVDASLEIFIVNDGQDEITQKFVPPATTHSLMLFNSPTSEYTVNLANAVKRSGGHAHLVTMEGMQML